MFVSAQALPGSDPEWVTNFRNLIPKALFPKAGDLSTTPETTLYNHMRLREVMDLAGKNPILRASDKNYIDPKFADWISDDSDPESLEVAEFIRNGITLKTPSQNFPLTDQSGIFPLEHDICTAHDLLKGCTEDGGYFGPIKYTGQKYLTISFTDSDGTPRTVTNKLNGAPIFRVVKSKRKMEYAGRMVTDLKRNLLNSDYSFEERTIKYPSFKEMVSASQGYKWMFIVDFVAAYRQLRYNPRSWGFVCFVFWGYLFIDWKLTFGWGPAARKFQKFSRTFIRQLCKKEKPFIQKSISPPHKSFIDDLKFVMNCYDRGMQMIEVLRAFHKKYNVRMDLSPDSKPVKEATYCGWVYNADRQAVSYPIPKRKKLLNMLISFQRGVYWSNPPPVRTVGLFTKREISQLHGTLNHFSDAHKEVFVKLTPLIRATDGLQDDDFIKVSFPKFPWLKRSIADCTAIVEQNEWVSFDKIVLPMRSFSDYALCFSDAAGIRDYGETEDNYGFGGLSFSHNFAFQVQHSVFVPFLTQIEDSNSTPDHIGGFEFLVQLFVLWYGLEILDCFEPNTIIECRTDSSVSGRWFNRGRAKHEAQSFFLERITELAITKQCDFKVVWISTEVMKEIGADDLSRVRCRFIHGLRVAHITPRTFKRFTHFLLQVCTPHFVKRYFEKWLSPIFLVTIKA